MRRDIMCSSKDPRQARHADCHMSVLSNDVWQSDWVVVLSPNMLGLWQRTGVYLLHHIRQAGGPRMQRPLDALRDKFSRAPLPPGGIPDTLAHEGAWPTKMRSARVHMTSPPLCMRIISGEAVRERCGAAVLGVKEHLRRGKARRNPTPPHLSQMNTNRTSNILLYTSQLTHSGI